MHVFLDQDGLSQDFKRKILADTIEKLSIQVRLFNISVHTGQISIWFEADIPRKNDNNMPMVWNFQSKIWLESY